MQTHPAIARQSLEEFFEQFGVHIADFVAIKGNPPNEIGTITEIDCRPAERFVHRQIGMPVARNARKITQRFFERLADNDAGIFDRMVAIYMQIAIGLNVEIDEAMPAERVEHVIEKAYAGRNVRFTRSVKIQRNLDAGLLGFAANGGDTICHIQRSFFCVPEFDSVYSSLSKQFAT